MFGWLGGWGLFFIATTGFCLVGQIDRYSSHASLIHPSVHPSSQGREGKGESGLCIGQGTGQHEKTSISVCPLCRGYHTHPPTPDIGDHVGITPLAGFRHAASRRLISVWTRGNNREASASLSRRKKKTKQAPVTALTRLSRSKVCSLELDGE